MKKTIFVLLFMIFAVGTFSHDKKERHGYPINPVSFTSVKLNGGFWGQRLKASRDVTIPLAFQKCEESGRYENFVRAANPSDDYKVGGNPFDDTDVYKTIEGAGYLLQTYPDARLEAYIDSVLEIVAKAQEPDGYLYTSRTMNPKHPHHWSGSKRWEQVEVDSHEFYNLGHMIEGAIAYYQATGKRKFLDIAIKYADCVCREIGDGDNQVSRVPGHQIAEMALAKLYLVTGDKKYLDQAKYFLDKRGYTTRKDAYSQAHQPVREQSEAVGHAVRATYMYAGMADIAALTNDKSYVDAIDRIWENIVSKKLYITGGVGARYQRESFGDDYELPNMKSYCETCAAIGNVYVNHRLFLLHGDSKYYDVLERTLYNGLISGVSLDGGSFFYPNPLESAGQFRRSPWFGCACCPSNICRFIPSFPGYIYATKEKDLYINLFTPNNSEVSLNGGKVGLSQETNYPWDGDVSITVTKNRAKVWTMKVRVPGWVRNQVVPSDLYKYADGKTPQYTFMLNGEQVNGELQNGYFCITRNWKRGDVVRVHFDMQPRIVRANDKIENNQGRFSVERGPIVYCAEWCDNDFDINSVVLGNNPVFEVIEKNDLLCGVTQLTSDVQSIGCDSDGRVAVKNVELKLIPYYAWCHRGSGAMTVWFPQTVKQAKLFVPGNIASAGKVNASRRTLDMYAMNDAVSPEIEPLKTTPFYHWWPRKSTIEWATYEFSEPVTISSSSVYWFEDAPDGNCRMPKWWKLYYKNASDGWTEVENAVGYGVEKGKFNAVKFDTVTAKAFKLEVALPEGYSTGIYEWKIE